MRGARGGQVEWTPDNYDPSDRIALIKALSIVRRSQMIVATGWTPKQYDEQSQEDILELEAYMRINNGLDYEETTAARQRGQQAQFRG